MFSFFFLELDSSNRLWPNSEDELAGGQPVARDVILHANLFSLNT
jgi:hypothetical protein